jgi:hypothetical protein
VGRDLPQRRTAINGGADTVASLRQHIGGVPLAGRITVDNKNVWHRMNLPTTIATLHEPVNRAEMI